MTDWAAISAAIEAATGRPFQYASHAAIGGGCINRTFRLRGRDDRVFFVKLNAADKHEMFAAESAGLEAIAATGMVRVPQPVTHGLCGAESFLVLEYLDLQPRGNAAQLGEQLAAMHRCTSLSLPCRERVGVRVDTLNSGASTPILVAPSLRSPPLQGGRNEDAASRFGFPRDNFLGTTPQPNGWADDWIAFWRERRLGYQLDLAARNGYGGKLQTLGEKLLDALPAFFDGYAPQPSLLHGDLWGGNHGYLADGVPVIFDPACYYGDRECDLAMTELFGGYSADFYAAYRASWPLDAGYAVRRELYNLYHILNHANLFGGGYARQAEQSMRALLGDVR